MGKSLEDEMPCLTSVLWHLNTDTRHLTPNITCTVEPVWNGALRKMKPIYFPFTYVPRWVAETLAACFKQFTVYQPSGRKLPAEMQPWVEANVMEVRLPVQT
jgi:hypothetical protein